MWQNKKKKPKHNNRHGNRNVEETLQFLIVRVIFIRFSLTILSQEQSMKKNKRKNMGCQPFSFFFTSFWNENQAILAS